MSTTTTIAVDGMTCGHCVSSVQSEVGKLDGVTDVSVDLSSGQVTVVADTTVTVVPATPVERHPAGAGEVDAGEGHHRATHQQPGGGSEAGHGGH